MPIVTIARQAGSLGDEIGRLVADRLSLRLVGSDIINDVAARLDVPPQRLNERDERESNLVSELVRTMRRLYPATHVPQRAGAGDPDESSYLQVIRQVIREVARAGNAVILG